MRWKYAFASLLLLAVNASAQERDKPYDDRWREMILERTTPREAIARFGIPMGDFSPSQINPDPIWRWLAAKEGETFRILTYKTPAPDVELLWLLFRNGKLVEISLKLPGHTLSPSALANIYGADFQPLRDPRNEVRTPRDFERRENMISTTTLDGVYHVAAVTKRSFIVALVGISGDPFADRAEAEYARKTPGFLRGRVTLIKIVSRKLENRDLYAAGAK